MKRAVACGLVTLATFGLYHATLLPGLDLGDTASFQAAVGSSLISPRQGYPLYYAIGNLFARLNPDDPARSLNLASAAGGALAAGVATWVAIELTASLLAGIAGGLLLAVSYTFWSQSIIAEVYSLHLLLIGLSLASLLAWAKKPTLARLGRFFLVYAVSFGNHQSMILLAPAAAWFVLRSTPGGAIGLLRPRVVLLALAAILLGAAQYIWNFQYLWYTPDRPEGWRDVLAAFWFDITKSDWRQSLVLAVPRSMLADRVGMFWFDVRQQFGVIGLSLALLGILFLRRSPNRAALIIGTYVVCTAFAFTYNVGDSHVFFLPSHLMMALSAACGIAWLAEIPARYLRAPRWASLAVGGLLLLYPAWRAIDTYPAVDRSRDTRAIELLDGLTAGLTGFNAALAADFNWQVQNALDYYAKYRKPDLPYFRLAETMWQFPFLVQSNEAIGREVVLSSASAVRLTAAYGSLYPLRLDPRVRFPAMAEIVRSLPPGTVYVFALLAPAREFPVDSAALEEVARRLTGARTGEFHRPAAYCVVAGSTGNRPALSEASDRPFRLTSRLGNIRLDLRMESWLPADTIRRAGFGHVIVNGVHAMTLERGLNLLVLKDDGATRLAAYEASLYAPQPRYVLSRP